MMTRSRRLMGLSWGGHRRISWTKLPCRIGSPGDGVCSSLHNLRWPFECRGLPAFFCTLRVRARSRSDCSPVTWASITSPRFPMWRWSRASAVLRWWWCAARHTPWISGVASSCQCSWGWSYGVQFARCGFGDISAGHGCWSPALYTTPDSSDPR